MYAYSRIIKIFSITLIPFAASIYGCSAAKVATAPPRAVLSQLASPFQGLGSKLRGIDTKLPKEDVRPAEGKESINLMNPAKAAEIRDKFGPAMEQMAGKVAAAFPYVEGYVVSAGGEKIILDFTLKNELIPGSVLTIFRMGEEFRHPLTGKVLGRFEKKLARAEIKEIGDRYSIARLVQKLNGDEVRPGDMARITAAKIKLAVLPFENITSDGGFDKNFMADLAMVSLDKTGRFELYDSMKLRQVLGDGSFTGDGASLRVLGDGFNKKLPDAYILSSAIREEGQLKIIDFKLSSAVMGKTIMADSLTLK